jgi:hypothetical protein
MIDERDGIEDAWQMIGERDGTEDARQMIDERVDIDGRYIFS